MLSKTRMENSNKMQWTKPQLISKPPRSKRVLWEQIKPRPTSRLPSNKRVRWEPIRQLSKTRQSSSSKS